MVCKERVVKEDIHIEISIEFSNFHQELQKQSLEITARTDILLAILQV